MKKTQEMNRTELVYELARHAHPSWYHSLLDWPTHQLRALLAYYREEITHLPENRPAVYRTKGLGDTLPHPNTAQEALRRAYEALRANPPLFTLAPEVVAAMRKAAMEYRRVGFPVKRTLTRWLPVWAIWHDVTIDVTNYDVLKLRSMWIRKGRTVRIITPRYRDFTVKIRKNLTIWGNLDMRNAPRRWGIPDPKTPPELTLQFESK